MCVGVGVGSRADRVGGLWRDVPSLHALTVYMVDIALPSFSFLSFSLRGNQGVQTKRNRPSACKLFANIHFHLVCLSYR